MQVAINLAKRNIGNTAENPSVGCIVVNNGRIVGQASTAPSGRPHAESIAIEQAGENSYNSDIYVTLEPCNNHGKTPPCVDNIINKKAKNVFISYQDPNPKTDGASIKKMEQVGVNVYRDFLHEKTACLYKGFATKHKTALPQVIVKIATSLDNKILKGNGKVRWITNSISKSLVHKIRSRADVLITSSRTITDDNPKLNVRLNGVENQNPEIYILGKIEDKALLKPDWQNIEKADIEQLLRDLANKGANTILVEAGPNLSKEFLPYADQIYHFKNNKTLGLNGTDLGYNPANLDNFQCVSARKLDTDIFYTYKKN